MSEPQQKPPDTCSADYGELIKWLRIALVQLESEPDSGQGAALAEACRYATDLKAAVETLAPSALWDLAREVESSFVQLRDGAMEVGKETLGAVFERLQAMEGVMAGQPAAEPSPLPSLNSVDSILETVLGGDSSEELPPELPPELTQELPQELPQEVSPVPANEETPAPTPSANDFQARLIEIFQVEAKEHLEGIRSILAEMGKDGVGPSQALLDEVFRRAHSLKGGARAVDLDTVEVLAHRMESVFAKIREGVLKIDESTQPVITRVLDSIEDWLAAVEKNQMAAVPTQTLEAIDRLLESESIPTAPVVAVVAPLESDVPPVTKQVPAVDVPASIPIAAPRIPPSVTAPPRPAPPAKVSAIVKMNLENLEPIFRSVDELLGEGQRQRAILKDLQKLGSEVSTIQASWEAVKDGSAVPLRHLSVMPDFASIAYYVDQVGRQVKALSRHVRSLTILEQRSCWAVRSLGQKLEQGARRIRMVPAQTVFGGFRKMVRDLARQEKKEVELVVLGFEVEADRLVLQGLKDPLMHIIRNAVCHGIEAPEDREAAGKIAGER